MSIYSVMFLLSEIKIHYFIKIFWGQIFLIFYNIPLQLIISLLLIFLH
jgi:hypothetical protein